MSKKDEQRKIGDFVLIEEDQKVARVNDAFNCWWHKEHDLDYITINKVRNDLKKDITFPQHDNSVEFEAPSILDDLPRRMRKHFKGRQNKAGENFFPIPKYRPMPSVRNGLFQQIVWFGVCGYMIVNHYDKEIVLVDAWSSFYSYWTSSVPLTLARPLHYADQITMNRLADLVNFIRISKKDGYRCSAILLSHQHFDHSEDIPVLLELMARPEGDCTYSDIFVTKESKPHSDIRRFPWEKIVLRGEAYEIDELPPVVGDFDSLYYFQTQYYGVTPLEIRITDDKKLSYEALSKEFVKRSPFNRFSLLGLGWNFISEKSYWIGKEDQLDKTDQVWLKNDLTKERYGKTPGGSIENIYTPEATDGAWCEIVSVKGRRLFYEDTFNLKMHNEKLDEKDCDQYEYAIPGREAKKVELKNCSFDIQPYIWDHMNLTASALGKSTNDANPSQGAGSYQRMTAFLVSRKNKYSSGGDELGIEEPKRTFFVGGAGEFHKDYTRPDFEIKENIETDLLLQGLMGDKMAQSGVRNGVLIPFLRYVPEGDLVNVQQACRKITYTKITVKDYLIYAHWDEFVRWIPTLQRRSVWPGQDIASLFRLAYFDNIFQYKMLLKDKAFAKKIPDENKYFIEKKQILSLGRVGSNREARKANYDPDAEYLRKAHEFEIAMPLSVKDIKRDIIGYPYEDYEGKLRTNNPAVAKEEGFGVPTDKWFVDYLPFTKKNIVKTYRDGESYCNDLYDDIVNAKEEICLTGLHFSGKFRLKRDGNESVTLQDLLVDVCNKNPNLKVYLLVNLFWEDEDEVVKDYEEARRDLDKGIWKIGNLLSGQILEGGGLANYLKYTCQFFNHLKKNKNISAYADLHRGYIMHSNHQKTIIIDKKISYFGGIDLTDIDGDRWDTSEHKPVCSNEERKCDKPERNWHDLQMKVTKEPDSDDSTCAVDFVYANFLARYNFGCLFDVKYKDGVTGEKYEDDPELIDIDDIDLSEVEKVDKIPGDCTSYVDVNKGTRCSYPGEFIMGNDDYPLVQIVRSMPTGKWWKNYSDNQCPKWNLSKNKKFEKSARESYIKGIKAAEKFIYLENQWICDEDIWETLLEKAEEKKHDNDFRITVVIPKKFLESAGLGFDQDKDLSSEVESVYEVLGERFAIFSILQPEGTKGTPHYKIPESSWEYVYVHSKLMIVDDVWMIIGSANAGGISLTGIGTSEEPDTELSAVIYDERKDSVVGSFRKELLGEHLGVNNTDDFIACHEEMHAQAKNQTYATSSEKKVHYNVLYNPHRKISDPGKWLNFNWKVIKKQAEMRAEEPLAMHQTCYNLSGPITVLQMMASVNPERYKKLADDIFFQARSNDCDIDVKGEDLLEVSGDSRYPLLEVDLMLASSMIDSENWVLDYEGTVDESVASECSDSDMKEFMEKVIPCKDVDHLSCEVWGEVKEGRKAGKALADKNAVVAVKVGLEMFFEENETAIEMVKKDPHVKEIDRGNPDYWINYMVYDEHASGVNPYCSPLHRDPESGYPGVLTTYDVKHKLPEKMFVRLIEPLKFHVNDENDVQAVTMTFWTWGKVSTLTMPYDRYENNVYGFFVGYPGEGSESDPDMHMSGDHTLKNGESKEHLQEDNDGTSLKVTCTHGKLKIKVETRIWWEWSAHSEYELSAGQDTLSVVIKEESKVCDQDCRVIVTAVGDSAYNIIMESFD